MKTRLLTCLATLSVVGILACSNDEDTTSSSSNSSSKAGATSTVGSGGSGASGSGGSGVGGGTGGACPTSSDPIELTSTAVMEMGLLPVQYKCDNFTGGLNISPPLAWTPGPAGTLSYAVFFRDITGNSYPHSVIWDIPACVLELPEDIEKTPNPTEVPGAKQGHAYNNAVGYEGPCAPVDQNPRTYQFEVYAIDVATIAEITVDSDAMEVEPVLESHSLGSDTLTVIEDEP